MIKSLNYLPNHKIGDVIYNEYGIYTISNILSVLIKNEEGQITFSYKIILKEIYDSQDN